MHFLHWNCLNLLRISLKFAPKVRINNIPALVQIMTLRRPGDKPLSEPMMVGSVTHTCVTRPQRFNTCFSKVCYTKSNKFCMCKGWQIIIQYFEIWRSIEIYLRRETTPDWRHNGCDGVIMNMYEVSAGFPNWCKTCFRYNFNLQCDIQFI